ncbi:hydroxyacylglutathione hydrolase [Sphingomonas sp. CJ99]
MTVPLEIVRIPALSDNYIWLVHEPVSGETIVVDPAAADPVLAAADARGWRIGAVWNTHWHPDHTGGNQGIKDATGAVVIAPAAESARIPTADRLVAEGDRIALGAMTAEVLAVPAHTAGHIAYHLPDARAVFVGDTMFAMGCGRLFEGTAAQMFANMQRLSALPPDTAVYCAHEYTLSNGRFAAHVEPDNPAIAARLAEVAAMRERGEPTIPTSIAAELATNPFMRAGSAERLGELRAVKDGFRG